jgi:hypothetical protein
MCGVNVYRQKVFPSPLMCSGFPMDAAVSFLFHLCDGWVVPAGSRGNKHCAEKKMLLIS